MSAIDAGPCSCGRGMVQQKAWNDALPTQRRLWLDEGKTTLQGRGLCRACYLKARRQGLIPPRKPVLLHDCERCGIRGKDTLCQDCAEVLAMDGAA